MTIGSPAALWEKAHNEGLWHVAWSKAVDGLTPAQAAWKPHPDRHSIWQNVHHIIFWREYLLRRLAGNPEDKQEIARRNWEEPAEVSGDGWQAALRRFADSHREIMEAASGNEKAAEKLPYLIAHDSYHVGQIMYIRALQGLPPLPD